ncbi:EpsG family protein [Priestia megaterium]|uniref:EpsG family protein n=1 Tax=Priestia megaterium TaxID=1404 RepID=UPI001F135D67|nr:EpsG family protein [Priestia megaterium]UMZ35645.1 EpsG family protein [Priestia megaterium]
MEYLQQNVATATLFWGVFIISLVLAHIYQKVRVKRRTKGEVYVRPINKVIQFLWVLLIIIGPALLIGFRQYSVGVDTYNYWFGYLRLNYVGSISEAYNTIGGSSRPLFFLIEYITFKLSNGNPTVFLIVIVFATLYIMVKALEKWIGKISLSLALLVYYSLFGMQLLNQSRQLLALSLVFLSISYLLEKKYKKYYLILLIGVLIHYTALIGLLFQLLSFQGGKFYSVKKSVYYSILIFSPVLLYPMLSLVSKFISSDYSDYLINISMDGLGFGLLLNILPVLIPILLFRGYLKNRSDQLLVRIAWLTFPLRLAGYYSYFLMRMYYYAAIMMVLIIPLSISRIKDKSSRHIAILAIVTMCFVYYIINYMYVNGNIMFPYRSIFSK